jgi:hypothetical protein
MPRGLAGVLLEQGGPRQVGSTSRAVCGALPVHKVPALSRLALLCTVAQGKMSTYLLRAEEAAESPAEGQEPTRSAFAYEI